MGEDVGQPAQGSPSESSAHLLLVPQPIIPLRGWEGDKTGRGSWGQSMGGIAVWPKTLSVSLWAFLLAHFGNRTEERGYPPGYSRLSHPWGMLSSVHGLPGPEIRSLVPIL